jgi:hypothetical protein
MLRRLFPDLAARPRGAAPLLPTGRIYRSASRFVLFKPLSAQPNEIVKEPDDFAVIPETVDGFDVRKYGGLANRFERRGLWETFALKVARKAVRARRDAQLG